MGRDHRKYGVTESHYTSLCQSFFPALRAELGSFGPRPSMPPSLKPATPDRRRDVRRRRVRPVARLVGRHGGRVRPGHPDIAVVRLQLDEPMPYHAGQYVSVHVPQRPGAGATCPRRCRRIQPGASSSTSGRCTGTSVSTAVVDNTAPGDRWRLSSLHGAMHVDRTAVMS